MRLCCQFVPPFWSEGSATRALGWAWWISIKGWPLQGEGNVNSCSPKWFQPSLKTEFSEPAHSSATVKFHFNIIKIKTSWLQGKKPQMLIELSGVHLLCSLKNNGVAFWRDFRHRLEAAEWQGQRLNTSLPPEQVQEQQQLLPCSPWRSLLEFAIPCDVELLPGEVPAWKG